MKVTQEEVDEGHKEGPPWKTVGRFLTFDEADQRRLELAIEEDLQVKVHWRRYRALSPGGPGEGELFFVVKARINPELALEEEAIKKRAEKKVDSGSVP